MQFLLTLPNNPSRNTRRGRNRRNPSTADRFTLGGCEQSTRSLVQMLLQASEARLDLLEVNHLLNSTPKHSIVELLFCHNALAISEGLLLPRYGGHYALYQTLRLALATAAKRAGCSSPATPHQLRHTFASEMLRLGVGLPALMQLLGHKDIRMTMRYLQVTQQDLQREFHA